MYEGLFFLDSNPPIWDDSKNISRDDFGGF